MFKPYDYSFKTSLDRDQRAEGIHKVTHATFVFDDVSEEALRDLAVSAAVVKYQARMRSNWEDHENGEEVTINVADLLTRLPRNVDPKASARKWIARETEGMSADEKLAWMEEQGLL